MISLQEQLEELHQEEFGETTMQKREQTQASKVHVMLCVINGQSEVAQQETSSTDNDPVEEASHALEPDDAAVKVQSVYRGHLVRRNMEEKKKADEEQAAIKIQAQVCQCYGHSRLRGVLRCPTCDLVCPFD